MVRTEGVVTSDRNEKALVLSSAFCHESHRAATLCHGSSLTLLGFGAGKEALNVRLVSMTPAQAYIEKSMKVFFIYFEHIQDGPSETENIYDQLVYHSAARSYLCG